METMSDKQVVRMHGVITRRIYAACAGGTQYGVDLPTLRIIAPGWHRAYVAVAAELRRRFVVV